MWLSNETIMIPTSDRTMMEIMVIHWESVALAVSANRSLKKPA